MNNSQSSYPQYSSQNIAPTSARSSPFNGQNISAPQNSLIQPMKFQWTRYGFLPIWPPVQNMFPSENLLNVNNLHTEKNGMKTATQKGKVGMKFQAQYYDPADVSARTNNRKDADYAQIGTTNITKGQAFRVKLIKAMTYQQYRNAAEERQKAIKGLRQYYLKDPLSKRTFEENWQEHLDDYLKICNHWKISNEDKVVFFKYALADASDSC